MTKKLRLVIALAALLAAPAQAEDLLEVYRLAQTHDPLLRAASASRNAALESEPLARANLLPALSTSASANQSWSDADPGGSDDATEANLSLNLSQALYRKDYDIRLEQAENQIAQAEAEYQNAAQSLVYRVSEAYFNVLAAQDNLQFAEAENAAISRQLEQAKQRYEVGLIAITSVHEAQAAYDQSRADLIRAQNTLDNAWEALREIIQSDVATLTPLQEQIPLTPPEPQDIAQWAAMAQQNNLQLKAALQAAELAKKNIELNDAADAPQVSLVGSYGIRRTTSDMNADSDSASVGVQLNLPLYTGGGVQAATRQARFNYQAAAEDVDRQRRAVDRQTRNAYRAVQASISAVEALQATIVSASSALEATSAGFEVGTRTMVDVLNAERDLYAARSNHASERYRYMLSRLQLKQAAGLLTTEDLQEISTWLQ